MIAAAFDEENVVLDGGPTPYEVESVSAWRGTEEGGRPVVITCWKVTVEELEEIQRTGRVWVLIQGERMPPFCVEGISPFKP